jgi:hypothetical protein
LTNIIKHETAEKASALLRRIADLIDNHEMPVRNVGAMVLPPPATSSPIRDAYHISIDIDFDILSEGCAAFVAEVRG